MQKLSQGARHMIADKATRALLSDGYEKRPGWCQRWVKQVLQNVGISPEMAVDGSPSARAAFDRYRSLGMVKPEGTVAQVGDILYKVGPNHGKAGHVGIFIGKGRVAENSSAHWTGESEDARGTRDLAAFAGYRVVRLWSDTL